MFNEFFNKIKKRHNEYKITHKDLVENKTKDETIPLWIFVNALTINELIRLVKYHSNLLGNKVYSKMKADWKDLANVSKIRNQIAHMNPIKEKIYFKTKNGRGSVGLKSIFHSMQKLHESFDKKLIKFWEDNKKNLPIKVKEKIFQKFFSFIGAKS